MRKLLAAACLSLLGVAPCFADVITDWNDKACVISASLGPGATGHRIMAVTQVAVYDAVSSITGEAKPYLAVIDAPTGASVDAAVAAANRKVLLEMVPAERNAIEAAYQAAIDKVMPGTARDQGVQVGEKAAAMLLERAGKDGAGEPEAYVPLTTPGRYVPTMVPVFSTWMNRKTWALEKPSQFRPGPPPALDSDTWKRDYEEIVAVGAKASTTRTAAQTDMAKFWEETRPIVYHPVLKSVAQMPGRSVTRNARLYAAGTMAVDDALIAVFDAKYTYQFWRPVTAIRNGGGNPALKGDPRWNPFIPTPMHPEYPCAHCVSSGALGAVIDADVGNDVTLSSTLGGTTREWKSVKAFMQEVADARVYDGVHYRNSTQVGSDLGWKVGKLAAQRLGI